MIIILGMPIFMWLGWLAFVSLMTQVGLGVALHIFHKNVFKYHRFFGFFTAVVVIIHVIPAVLYWFYGVTI